MPRPSINIPDYWTDEQALAVFQFIDEIREQIWQRYSLQIQMEAKSSRQITTINTPDPSDEDDEFFNDEVPF